MSIETRIRPASDNVVCNVYLGADFVVTSGLNMGDGITGAEDSWEGDTYEFSPTAIAYDLVIGDNGFGNTSTHYLFEVNDIIAPGSEIGRLGRGFVFDSRLTFMGKDGSTVEVFVVRNTAKGATPYAEEYFLPMQPLTPGLEYTLIKANPDPGEFKYSEYGCVCFARGTAIRLADGTEKLVETLVEGDKVMTKDNGAQPVRWVGGRTARAYGHLAPIVITAGALGNHSDLIVSQRHRMMLSDWRAEIMHGTPEVLVRARDLVNGDTIYKRDGGVVEYFHILFDQHEIIYAEGVATESLHINKNTLDSMAEDSRAEIVALFPEIEESPQISAVASRMSLRSYEAAALLKQVGFQ